MRDLEQTVQPMIRTMLDRGIEQLRDDLFRVPAPERDIDGQVQASYEWGEFIRQNGFMFLTRILRGGHC